MDIIFRKGNLSDINEVYLLFQAAINSMIKTNIYQWDEIYPNKEILQTDIKQQQLYVGIIENKIAVVYVLNKNCDPEYNDGKWNSVSDNFMIIHRLCVHPNFQNMGIAKNTLLHIEQQLKKDNVDSMRLDVYSKNPYALKLYNSLGYKTVGKATWRKGLFYLMDKVL